jgi:hypothetical protein
LLLNSILNVKRKKKTNWELISLGIFSLVLTLLFINSISENKKMLAESTKSTTQLKDSILNLQSWIKIEKLKEPKDSSITILEYKVRIGDYPSKIAMFFYNDWKMYRKIEIDNNLIKPYALKEGQKLKIIIKQ